MNIVDRNRLVEENLPLVHHQARRYYANLEYEDKVQSGVVGLIRAAELFEPQRGHAFATYAVWWIRQAIQRMGRTERAMPVPAYAHVEVMEIRNRIRALSKRGDLVSEEAINSDGRFKAKNLGNLMTVAHGCGRLDASIGDESTHLDLLASDEDVEMEVERRLDGFALWKICVEHLPLRSAHVIGMRFGLNNQEPMSLEAVGRLFGISRERVRQIQDEALLKMRQVLREAALKAEEIKAMRTRLCLTQREAATRCGVHPNVWQKWEKGNAQPSTESEAKLERMKAELGNPITIEQLLAVDDPDGLEPETEAEAEDAVIETVGLDIAISISDGVLAMECRGMVINSDDKLIVDMARAHLQGMMKDFVSRAVER